ncbi:helix-turn-helix transcriptional regulator [Streptomyces sp. NPDC001678]|uniref:helix-turn-helix domain-containing protein n=1 Tax=Streptomyces sp. NPDC001678 TaxID=3364599 RepID=UPI0036D1291B
MSEGAQDGPAFYGSEVLHAREHAGVTQQQLADAIGYKVPYVSKVENGHTLGSELFAQGCDRYFGTPGYFLRLRRRISDAGHPEWFVPYVKLERQAAVIEDYSTTFLMGMLQTSAYAGAIFRASYPRESDAQITARVGARLARHSVIEREDPPRLWVIIHEAALRMIVGDIATMGGQLEHLLAEAEAPNVMIQVLTNDAGTPAAHLPFTLLTPKDGGPTVLHEETRHHARVDDSVSAVAEAQDVYNRLRADALSPQRSTALIRTILKEFSHEHRPGPHPRDMGEVELQRRNRRPVRRVRQQPRVIIRRRPRSGQQEP